MVRQFLQLFTAGVLAVAGFATSASAWSMEPDYNDPGMDAAHTISLVWESSGTPDLCLSGDDPSRQVLYVVLTASNPRIFGVDVSVLFDLNSGESMGGNELDYLGGGEMTNGALGMSSMRQGLTLFRESNGVSEGIVTNFDVVFENGIEHATVTLGSIVFNVNPGALDNGIDILPSIDPRFENGVFGLNGQDLSRRGLVDFEGASVKRLPEPTTAMLLVTGLALMGWSGAQRKR